jgi:hypothetical protein
MNESMYVKRAPMTGHVYTAQSTTTHATYVIPAECKGRICRFKASTQAVCIVFGLAGVEADTAAFSSVSDGVLTPSVKSGLVIAAGELIDIEVPTAATHFSVEALADTAVWSLEPCAELAV